MGARHGRHGGGHDGRGEHTLSFLLMASARMRGFLARRRPQDVVVGWRRRSRQRARVLTAVKARRCAPPPLRGADGLDERAPRTLSRLASSDGATNMTPYMLWSMTCSEWRVSQRSLTSCCGARW